MQKKVEELKRSLILDEASTHFLTQSFDKVQVAEIAKKAGVSVGTIYNLFGSKEGLYEAFVDRQITAAYATISSECAKMSDPIEQLRFVTSYKFHYFEENREVIKANILANPLLLHASTYNKSPAMKKIMELLGTIIDHIGRIYPLRSYDLMQLAYHYKALTNSYIERWVDADFDLRTKIDEATDLFLFGITDTTAIRTTR
ncbi:MAG: TetR/AcrR family transcriptional regulator [Campylobacterales bacterium]